MRLKSRMPLALEALEDRWVPATVRFDGSNLFVSNPTIAGGASTLSVIQTAAPNTFQVKDGASNNGFYTLTGNLTINGNNAKDTIAVNATSLVGNVFVTAGNGPDTVSVDGTVATGFIAGNTRVTVGSANSTVNFGATVGLTNKGSVFLSSSGANSTANLGNAANPIQVLGDANIVGVNSINLGFGKNDNYGGNINITPNTNTAPLTLSEGSFGGTDVITVGGSFNITSGTAGAAANSVFLRGMVIGKNLVVNLPGSTDFEVSSSFGSTTVVEGTTIYHGGNGTQTISLSGGKFLGDVLLTIGNGDAGVDLSLFGAGTLIQGNLQVNAGNGNLGTAPFGADIQATIFGNASFNLGNGNNSVAFDTGSSVGGTVNYTGGNGGNNFGVTNTSGSLMTVNVRFGNNLGTGNPLTSDVFTIGAGTTPGSLTGKVSWGDPSLLANGNAYVDNGYVWTNNILLTNVPS